MFEKNYLINRNQFNTIISVKKIVQIVDLTTTYYVLLE